jgi:hypothetical protein
MGRTAITEHSAHHQEGKNMGWGDNRKSPKMRRRVGQKKYKERQKRRREQLRRERGEQSGT